MVFSNILLAEIGTCALIPTAGFPVRTTKTERDVVSATFDSLDPAVVMELLKGGAAADKPDATGCTPLHLASVSSSKPIVLALLNQGANPDWADCDGYTPLHKVAYHGHNPAVKLLLERGADPNKKNNLGDTPLHCAVREGHQDAARILVKSFAKTDVANNDGHTPLTLAGDNQALIDALNGAGPREDSEFRMMIEVKSESHPNEAKSRRVSGKSDVYQIFVKGTFHMDEKTLTLKNLSPYTSINALKDILTGKGGPPADYMYLMCATKNLEDGHTLSHYNITTESTIHMLVRARGSCSTCQA